MSKLVKASAWLLAIVVSVTFAATVAVFIAVNKDMTPYRMYDIRTGSMSPTIPPKSEVFVRKGDYKQGQVISFTYGRTVITHRLVRLDHGYATTKGDANPSADAWKIPEQNIIGGVVSAPKHLGWWITFASNWTGRIDILIGLIIAWSPVFFVYSRRHPNEPSQQTDEPSSGLPVTA